MIERSIVSKDMIGVLVFFCLIGFYLLAVRGSTSPSNDSLTMSVRDYEQLLYDPSSDSYIGEFGRSAGVILTKKNISVTLGHPMSDRKLKFFVGTFVVHPCIASIQAT